MSDSPSQRALTASATALVVAVACVAMFLPPMVHNTVASVPLTVLVGLSAALAVVLHWAFLGIAAHRADRSVGGWVALGLMFPIGGAAALLMLAWLDDEARIQANGAGA
jgi:hypothetical protein